MNPTPVTVVYRFEDFWAEFTEFTNFISTNRDAIDEWDNNRDERLVCDEASLRFWAKFCTKFFNQHGIENVAIIRKKDYSSDSVIVEFESEESQTYARMIWG